MLHKRLLVDRPLQLALLDQPDGAGREIECADLGLAVRHLHRRQRGRGERRAQGHDVADGRILLQLCHHPGLRAGHVVARHGQHEQIAVEGLLDTVAAFLKLHRALLLVDADRALDALGVELVAHRLAGDRLVLADIGHQARLLPVVAAGVEADHRNAGPLRLLDYRRQGIGEGQGQGDAVDMLLQHVGDQLSLARGGRVGEIDQLDVVLGSSRVGALANDVPERVAGLAVGDHGEGVMRVLSAELLAGLREAAQPSATLAAMASTHSIEAGHFFYVSSHLDRRRSPGLTFRNL